MQTTPSRKRPAPGTSPLLQATSQAPLPNTVRRYPDMSDPSQLSNDQFLAWSAGNNLGAQSDALNQPLSATDYQNGLGNSGLNQLVRRNTSMPSYQQQRAPILSEGRGSPNGDDSDADDGELELRAAAVKKEALSRRPPKQIPPFIQKLSSFLDDYSNYNLIRWAEDGRSFIISDEDKFANELIPLMFKHKNYPSFVRQLNMYGFHKKVGLSDNSMRASEKKTKVPSGYQHKYFRRGRPELQWLIEKPRAGTVTSRRRPGRDEDEDEGQEDEKTTTRVSGKNTELVTVPRADLANVRTLQKEVESLQRSQQQIYAILKQMRDENNQYIKQASAMVANHERHESSINAILQFFASFYQSNLQGREGAPGMFPSSHPQRHGNVVEDMDDVADTPSTYGPAAGPLVRRPLALLPPPEQRNDVSNGDATSPRRRRSHTKSPSVSSPPPGKTSYANAASSDTRQQHQRTGPGNNKTNDDIFNALNRTNTQSSGATPRFDFSSALRHYTDNPNGNNTALTPEQRDTMLSIMSGASTPNPARAGGAGAGGSSAAEPSIQSYLDYSNNFDEQLSMLQRLQQEQDDRVQDLAGRLSPLSPNGSIPGLDIPPSPQSLNGQSTSAYPGSFNPNSDGYDFNTFLNDDLFPGDDLPVGLDDTAEPTRYSWEDELAGGAGGGNDNGGDDKDPFGDGGTTQARAAASRQQARAPRAGASQVDGGGGRQQQRNAGGSAATSSGAPTPRPTVTDGEADEDEDEADDGEIALGDESGGGGGGVAQGRAKRRRLDGS